MWRRPLELGAIAVASLALSCAGVTDSGDRKGSPSTSDSGAPKGEWVRPEGQPDELARTLSVKELIARWRVFPPQESQSDIHADYARALGLKGEEAAEAVPHLAPHATHENLYIRQGAMAGLSGIGERGLPGLVTALEFGGTSNDGTVHTRWDAADFIAKMGPKAREAVPKLLARIVHPDENVNVKSSAVAALVAIGPESAAALREARAYFYAQDGLSPGETDVLRSINVALSGMPAAPAEESAEGPTGESAEEPAGESAEEPVEQSSEEPANAPEDDIEP